MYMYIHSYIYERICICTHTYTHMHIMDVCVYMHTRMYGIVFASLFVPSVA